MSRRLLFKNKDLTPTTFLRLENNPREKDIRKIHEGLLADHASKGFVRKPQKLVIFIRDDNDQVCGGIIGTTCWDRLIIEKLWVEGSFRGMGNGKRLLHAAEEEAVRRGCTYAHTDTFTWQALSFYEKCGYEEYATLKDYPAGQSLHYVQKKLTQDKTAD